MQYNKSKYKTQAAFSLVEVVFAAAIFLVVAISIYQGFLGITKLVSISRDKVAAADLLNSELELVRNIPYSKVGILGGIPVGVLTATSTVTIENREFRINRSVRNVDNAFDGTIGGTPNDLSPADYKLVEITVTCDTCKNFSQFSANTYVSPKNLESASTNGALFVRVFDANGQPVPQADVNVKNTALGVDIYETTDNNGLLQIVDAPPAQNSYKITVSKSGFTTDKTYATSTGNPNPIKLDATVLLQQLTQASFIIDRTSSISVHAMTNTCSPVADVPFTVNGTKLIGTTPDVPKWVGNFTTDSSGFKNMTDIEWDIYTFTTNGGFYLAGTNPISSVAVLPNSSQNVDLVISQETPPLLRVKVKDSLGLPISGASVRLSGVSFDQTLVTDQGYFRQTDWSGGSGQTSFTDPTKYHSSDGNIDVDSPNGELKLLQSLGSYVPFGELTSSVFDTGTSSNWSKVDILPTDQPLQAGSESVRFLIATSPDNTVSTVWNYLGPNGSTGNFTDNYYTITNNNINPIHNGDRYVRYKIFLATGNSDYTPNVSDFVVSFSSSCIPPGQVVFSALNMQNYSLDVDAPGFLSQNIDPVTIDSNWKTQEVTLSP